MLYSKLTINELANYLHLSRSDVETLVHQHEIPFEKHGNRLTFRKKDIDAWASQRILGLPANRLSDFHRTISARIHSLSSHHLIISKLLQKNFVHPALVSKTKPSILRNLVELAEQTGLVTDSKDLLASLQERENLCSTAIPDGIALLHPRHHEPYMFNDSFIVIAKTIHPVPFGAPDGKKTDLFFLICCQDDRIHLHVLARLCMMCKRTNLLLHLREAADSDSIIKSLRQSEEKVIQQL